MHCQSQKRTFPRRRSCQPVLTSPKTENMQDMGQDIGLIQSRDDQKRQSTENMHGMGQDIELIALHQQLKVMIPDIVRDKIANLEIDYKAMAFVLESETPFDKPDRLLTRLPLKYPPDTPFKARLQLLQADSHIITWEGKEYVCNQLIFGHSGTDFVARAIYMCVGAKPVDWHDMLYNIYDVNFAFEAKCTVASKSPANALSVLVVSDMTPFAAHVFTAPRNIASASSGFVAAFMHLVKEDQQRRVKFIDYQPEPRAVDGVFLDGTPLEDKPAVNEATRV